MIVDKIIIFLTILTMVVT